MTQPPDEKPRQRVTQITTETPIQRIVRFSVPNSNVPDLELIFDKRGWGRLRVRWCPKLSRPVLEALLAERKAVEHGTGTGSAPAPDAT